jgi:DNA invertase Pin-like site-specific DNA recombinase
VTATAYIRKSSLPGRGTASVSFEMQERAVRELALRHGDELPVTIASDMGRSGGSTRRRPEYQALLDAIEAGQVQTIYSYSLSRLSRSVLDFSDLLERCRAHDVAIRLVQEGQIDYSSATGRAFANMAAVFAAMERELAAERNGAAQAERRERGETLGQAPYGFSIRKGALVERADEPLQAVFDAFRQVGSFGGTARLLNRQGVRTRHGRPWTHGVVSDVLRRTAPADLAVPLMGRRSGASPRSAVIFAGLLRCRCGALLTPRRDAANPTGVSGYYCSRSYRTPDHGRMHTPESPILEWAQAEAARLNTPSQVELNQDNDERARGGIEQRRVRVVDAYVDGAIDKSERDRRLRKLDDESDALTARTYIAQVPAIDWSWPPADINSVLRAMWEHIELDASMRPVAAVWRVPEWRQ